LPVRACGERQLVSLLRLGLLDPAVVVLDEATSSIDVLTEAPVEEARSPRRRRTVVVIAHRLSTVVERRPGRPCVRWGGGWEGHHAELVEVGGGYPAPFGAWVRTGPDSDLPTDQ